ncbi:MAG: hypothetical protein A2X83_06795 [Desulfuromonadales bacterium GWD2_54_10]|nr:MAG: hypothetical protein A2X83_06795 [Desulfuromonadales bacterium GWD2_54_10]
MSPFRNRLKTPEEIELDRKRRELAYAQGQLAEKERVFSVFKAEIRMFEQVYEEILGTRIAELEELEWQLNGLLGKQDVATVTGAAERDDSLAFSQHHTDLLDDDAEPALDVHHKSLKNIYREVAKAIHPDLASDEEERQRRQELMAVANHAYEVGDRSVLEDILSDWELGSDVLDGVDIAMELVRVIRQIARVQQNLHAVKRQIEELKTTDIYCFKLRVDEALSDGIDLMAEMAATVEQNIAKIRNRLAALRGDSEFDAGRNGPPPETRIIRFPVEYSCGILYERNLGSVDYRDWHRLGSARGVREFFLDKALRLDVKGAGENEMLFLDSLKADDFQALYFDGIDDSALVHIAHLTGLQELYLSSCFVSDSGLQLLRSLQGLKRLNIYHTDIGDTGLMNLARLKGLKWLTCSETCITEEGLKRFRQALPGCKTVSFKWRSVK